MAEGKTLQELKIENQLKAILAEERAMKRVAGRIASGDYKFSIKKDDLIKGIVLREVLGPPKAFEG